VVRARQDSAATALPWPTRPVEDFNIAQPESAAELLYFCCALDPHEATDDHFAAAKRAIQAMDHESLGYAARFLPELDTLPAADALDWGPSGSSRRRPPPRPGRIWPHPGPSRPRPG
jgi:hypothetical protein